VLTVVGVALGEAEVVVVGLTVRALPRVKSERTETIADKIIMLEETRLTVVFVSAQLLYAFLAFQVGTIVLRWIRNHPELSNAR
jgi:hypothetical protein